MDLEELHDSTFKNVKIIKKGKTCGCFYCLEIFKPEEIDEWADDGATAICPYCSIDSVISSDTVKLTDSLLREMHKKYFVE